MFAQPSVGLVIGVPIASTLCFFAVENNGMGHSPCSFYIGFHIITALLYDLYFIIFSEFFGILQTRVQTYQTLGFERQTTVEIIAIGEVVAQESDTRK